MKKREPLRTAATLATASVFAALVAVATYLFVIPIPATTGYFNLGETVIYIAALTFGPYVGAFAGTGAAIADIVIPGGAVFAPGTFIIKALEGATVGYLNRKFHRKFGITLSAIISVLAGGSLMIVGYFTYEISVLGVPIAAALLEVPFNVVQMLAGAAIAVPIMHAVYRIFPQLKSNL